ncbi:MAG: TetR/AcrR family transcriptional regulator [Gemmatimonadaceae bacterium]|nr:TetR/AcrR family transcriptional regulator [Gemmatimonadaceae bacterium]
MVREGSRTAILAAARQQFGERGYARTSLVDVSRAAHVTKGAVYHHFGSKEGLFRCVYDEVETESQVLVRTAVDFDQHPLEIIQAIVAAYLDVAMDPIVQRVTLVDAPAVLGPEPDGPLEQQQSYIDFRSFLEIAILGNHIKPVDPGAITRVIRGASTQAALYIAQADDQTEARVRIGEVLQVLIGGLATDQTPTTNEAV